MKDAQVYHDEDRTPEVGEVFKYKTIKLVAVPTALAHCDDCYAHTCAQPDRIAMGRLCAALPPCEGVSFITKAEYDTSEFKVRLVEWRMGLEDET